MAQVVSLEGLLHVLKSITAGHPEFVLRLGAGASASSGVKTGAQLVKEWRGSSNETEADLQRQVEHQECYGSACDSPRLSDSGGGRIMVPERGPKYGIDRAQARSVSSYPEFGPDTAEVTRIDGRYFSPRRNTG
jgi:hypothetical protein